MEASTQRQESKEEIDRLYTLIEKRPRNARLMSKLSCCLQLEQKHHLEQLSPSLNEHQDPVYWARKAIQVAPEKPYGYAALSMMTTLEFSKRRENLQKAVDLCDKSPPNSSLGTGTRSSSSSPSYPQVFVLGLQCQLLVEPREEETRQVRGTVGRASASHPRKRPLSQKEQDSYHQLALQLKRFWKDISTQEGEHDSVPVTDIKCVCLQVEYKLGALFRKLEPQSVCRGRSQMHFQRVVQHLSMPQLRQECHKEWSMAQFWLATLMSQENAKLKSVDPELTGSNGMSPVALDRCPKDYVVGLYSSFADRFDALLVEKLNYQTPTLLKSLLDDTIPTDSTNANNGSLLFARTLDLGCGTGLSGLAFRNCTNRLEGMDLSPEMIAKARERGCYDALRVGDVLDISLTEYENNNEAISFSLVVACDVFCYIGNLEPVFDKVYQLLENGGVFAFSTELLLQENDKGDSGTGGKLQPCYKLHECARFSHSQRYIQELAQNRFKITAMKQSVIRKNQGDNVQGLLTILSKS